MEMIANAGKGPVSTVRIHADLFQGSEEWVAARCGMLTASEMSLIITPATLKAARNEKERSHLYELLAQRITGHVEPHYISDDMLRGQDDEAEALTVYAEHYAPTETVGFITNDRWGFTLGYSPDGLVGSDGSVEIKSRRQKYQIETFVVHALEGTIPAEFLIQVQTGLLVAERSWCDFLSYSGGLPLARIRVYPDERVQDAIVSAAGDVEKRLAEAHARYREAVAETRAVPTKRRALEIVL